MIVGGALTGIVLALPLVLSAIRSMQRAAQTRSAISSDEMPIKLLYMAIGGAFLVLAVVAIFAVPEIEPWRAASMALFGTLWIWVAGVVLSECIGRTQWSPLSGMTLIGVTILIFVASGLDDRTTVVASVVVGAGMCVAMAQATDLMLDLKTGYLVGAFPRRQQLAQFAGTWLGPILIMGMVGLGFYLPFNIILTYTLGTLLRIYTDAKIGRKFSEEVGVPIAAGLIVGEALIGVGYSLWVVFG